ncbi:uncharacterized protein LOC122947947 [Acropora millepora]|uniref:uncharacterized protein LOC122947947 n=1 Tax=Acropora millepora TaxID=45264 RepID=UPI001CF5453C|nr:uncharacterized protein LOC122947947 [Acropora millepora]
MKFELCRRQPDLKIFLNKRKMFLFSGPENVSRSYSVPCWYIHKGRCPLHWVKLGLGWTRGASMPYGVPASLSNLWRKKGNWPKGERWIGRKESEMLLRRTGLFVQFGSGICRNYRELIKTGKREGDDSQQESSSIQERFQEITLDEARLDVLDT